MSKQDQDAYYCQLDKLIRALGEADKTARVRNLYCVDLENLVGYIPLVVGKSKLDETKLETIKQKAYNNLHNKQFAKAYDTFEYLTKNQTVDPCTSYYWLGVISVHQKNYEQAYLHFCQFYKAMHIYSKSAFFTQNKEKLPRSILQIIHCCLILKSQNKAIKLYKLFEQKYPDYRASVYEKEIISQIW
ncbi:MAG: hypothetical protein H6845_02435 [Alphaproteobacteria bacterium]|nr:MAG: hypothetical protein H6845_02435 [Alphaproteobacteria bacterium]